MVLVVLRMTLQVGWWRARVGLDGESANVPVLLRDFDGHGSHCDVWVLEVFEESRGIGKKWRCDSKVERESGQRNI